LSLLFEEKSNYLYLAISIRKTEKTVINIAKYKINYIPISICFVEKIIILIFEEIVVRNLLVRPPYGTLQRHLLLRT